MVKINVRALKALAKVIITEDSDKVEFREVPTGIQSLGQESMILATVGYEDYRGDTWTITYVVTTEGAYRLD